MNAFFSRYTLLISLIAVVGCASTEPVSREPSGLSIIHLNDTYRIDAVEEGRSGGFGRVATLVRNLKSAGRSVVITHGGDFLFPSLESQLWNGKQMVEALNFLDALAPLVAVPGNHEFDPRTPAVLKAALEQANFDWLAGNMRLATGDAALDQRLTDSKIIEIAGLRIGIFGLTLLPSDGGNLRDYAPVDGDYLQTAQALIAKLDGIGVDVIVGLTHLHIADDKRVAALKAQYPSFQLIVGGHEHEPEYATGDDDNAAIMKGASNARVVWQIDIDAAGGAIEIRNLQIPVDDTIEEDADYSKIAAKWRNRLLEKIPFLESTVGYTDVQLDAREVTVRNEESNWGNFIADQMRGAFGEPTADFAFVNSGTLRIDDFIADDITFEDIGRTFGFSSFLRHMTIAGKDFRQLMENGYRGEGPSKGYFPQFSGFRVCIDRSQPDGSRIVQMQSQVDSVWQEISASKEYSLIAPDFLYRGGDGYDFSAAHNVSKPGSELKYLVLDGVIRAQAQGSKIGANVDPNKPRIGFTPEAGELCFR